MTFYITVDLPDYLYVETVTTIHIVTTYHYKFGAKQAFAARTIL